MTLSTTIHYDILIFQIQRFFAGYLSGGNDTIRLHEFFRKLPQIMENKRLQSAEWELVIHLVNEIFKVNTRIYNWSDLISIIDSRYKYWNVF